MKNTVQQDTQVLAINNVVKNYSQWQRSGKVRDIIKNLVKPEKRVKTALDGISLQVNRGEFVAYAGANGAGKSTTIKILCGILQPTSGKVSVLGLDPAKDRVKLMKKIGIVFGQRTELWWDQPIMASFEWKKAVWGIPDSTYKKNVAMVTELLDLGDLLHTFARELSLGQRMRADLGLMLLHDPELIFLDEPTLGLDVLAKRQMINFLKILNRERKTTIMVTSHDMDDLEEMAKRIVLLSNGRIAYDGNFDGLRDIAGKNARLSVTTSSSEAPRFHSLSYLGSRENTHDYAFDSGKTPIKDILAEISLCDGILNVEIKKAPIEQVIASLYQSWKS